MCIHCSPESAVIDGMKMKPGVVVIKCSKYKSNPTFCEVQQLFIVDGELLLGVTVLGIVEYSIHHHSWIVMKQDQLSLLSSKDIPSKQVLTLRPVKDTFSKQYFLTLKHSL